MSSSMWTGKMLPHFSNGRLQPASRYFTSSKTSHTEESANYKTHSGTSGSSTPDLINAAELPRQVPREAPARADKPKRENIMDVVNPGQAERWEWDVDVFRGRNSSESKVRNR